MIFSVMKATLDFNQYSFLQLQLTSFATFKTFCLVLDCTTLVGNDPLAIVKANQLDVLPVWGPEFELKFDVNFGTWHSNFGNIFHLTNKSELNCCDVGTRVPAMWTKKGTRDQLTLKTAIGDEGSKIFENELGRFQTGEWYSFVISQSKYEVRFPIYSKQQSFTTFQISG